MSWRLVFPFMENYPVITPDDISAFETQQPAEVGCGLCGLSSGVPRALAHVPGR